jgi:hypothetical protein
MREEAHLRHVYNNMKFGESNGDGTIYSMGEREENFVVPEVFCRTECRS